MLACLHAEPREPDATEATISCGPSHRRSSYPHRAPHNSAPSRGNYKQRRFSFFLPAARTTNEVLPSNSLSTVDTCEEPFPSFPRRRQYIPVLYSCTHGRPCSSRVGGNAVLYVRFLIFANLVTYEMPLRRPPVN